METKVRGFLYAIVKKKGLYTVIGLEKDDKPAKMRYNEEEKLQEGKRMAAQMTSRRFMGFFGWGFAYGTGLFPHGHLSLPNSRSL